MDRKIVTKILSGMLLCTPLITHAWENMVAWSEGTNGVKCGSAVLRTLGNAEHITATVKPTILITIKRTTTGTKGKKETYDGREVDEFWLYRPTPLDLTASDSKTEPKYDNAYDSRTMTRFSEGDSEGGEKNGHGGFFLPWVPMFMSAEPNGFYIYEDAFKGLANTRVYSREGWFSTGNLNISETIRNIYKKLELGSKEACRHLQVALTELSEAEFEKDFGKLMKNFAEDGELSGKEFPTGYGKLSSEQLAEAKGEMTEKGFEDAYWAKFRQCILTRYGKLGGHRSEILKPHSDALCCVDLAETNVNKGPRTIEQMIIYRHHAGNRYFFLAPAAKSWGLIGKNTFEWAELKVSLNDAAPNVNLRRFCEQTVGSITYQDHYIARGGSSEDGLYAMNLAEADGYALSGLASQGWKGNWNGIGDKHLGLGGRNYGLPGIRLNSKRSTGGSDASKESPTDMTDLASTNAEGDKIGGDRVTASIGMNSKWVTTSAKVGQTTFLTHHIFLDKIMTPKIEKVLFGEDQNLPAGLENYNTAMYGGLVTLYGKLLCVAAMEDIAKHESKMAKSEAKERIIAKIIEMNEAMGHIAIGPGGDPGKAIKIEKEGKLITPIRPESKAFLMLVAQKLWKVFASKEHPEYEKYNQFEECLRVAKLIEGGTKKALARKATLEAEQQRREAEQRAQKKREEEEAKRQAADEAERKRAEEEAAREKEREEERGLQQLLEDSRLKGQKVDDVLKERRRAVDEGIKKAAAREKEREDRERREAAEADRRREEERRVEKEQRAWRQKEEEQRAQKKREEEARKAAEAAAREKEREEREKREAAEAEAESKRRAAEAERKRAEEAAAREREEAEWRRREAEERARRQREDEEAESRRREEEKRKEMSRSPSSPLIMPSSSRRTQNKDASRPMFTPKIGDARRIAELKALQEQRERAKAREATPKRLGSEAQRSDRIAERKALQEQREKAKARRK